MVLQLAERMNNGRLGVPAIWDREDHFRIQREVQVLFTGLMTTRLQTYLAPTKEWVVVLSNQEFAKLANEGGASRNFQTLEPAKGPGIMVSKPGAEKITDAPMTADQAKSFLKEHEVQSTAHDYQGAWKSGGKIFHDVSRKFETLSEARVAGEKHKQIAGYDLGGTDVRRPEGGNVYFSRQLKGVESNPEFKASATETSAAERMEPKPKAMEFAEQSHISRGARYRGKPISINEVYAKIAKNRRGRGV